MSSQTVSICYQGEISEIQDFFNRLPRKSAEARQVGLSHYHSLSVPTERGLNSKINESQVTAWNYAVFARPSPKVGFGKVRCDREGERILERNWIFSGSARPSIFVLCFYVMR